MRLPRSAAGLVLIAVMCVAAMPAALMADDPCPDGQPPCYIVQDYYPFKQCKSECDRTICGRGYGAWQSEDVCCAAGVAFPEGCTERPDQCWVVESFQIQTCRRDDRRCMQGYGVWPSEESCCLGSFKSECAKLPESEEPCYVVDTYWPTRLCRESNTLCTPSAAAVAAGLQSWPTKEECCMPGAAFGDGCSSGPPPTPCWTIDTYNPVRKCRLEEDVAGCNRGWGVYQSEAICCAPNVAFPDGCSEPVAATPTATPAPAKPAPATPKVPATPAAATPMPLAAATPMPPAAATPPVPPAAATPVPPAAATPVPPAAATPVVNATNATTEEPLMMVPGNQTVSANQTAEPMVVASGR
ncbi:hypothetical protein FOA52_000287 [Chlamydomonas sp. UWO 241]|nr:hypothetical protein FOA52_000287 [Chlamydomonas sp. UWO 241]